MIKLILLVIAVSIFGVGFLTMIFNQLTSAMNIINDLYNSSNMLIRWSSNLAILFSHPFMLVISGLYIVYFIISKTLYN